MDLSSGFHFASAFSPLKTLIFTYDVRMDLDVSRNFDIYT